MSEHEIEVELWSLEPSAVQATMATISMLPGGTKLIERNGKFYLSGGNVQFAAFACRQQGYVKQVHQ